jgi:acetyl-CoA synthetase
MRVGCDWGPGCRLFVVPAAFFFVYCRELALVPPLLGSSQRLLLRDHTETYFAGMPLAEGSDSSSSSTSSGSSGGVPLRRHGDEAQALPGGYYRALGRCDDTMNLGGIKVGF